MMTSIVSILHYCCGKVLGNTGLTTSGGDREDGADSAAGGAAHRQQSNSPRPREPVRVNVSATANNINDNVDASDDDSLSSCIDVVDRKEGNDARKTTKKGNSRRHRWQNAKRRRGRRKGQSRQQSCSSSNTNWINFIFHLFFILCVVVTNCSIHCLGAVTSGVGTVISGTTGLLSLSSGRKRKSRSSSGSSSSSSPTTPDKSLPKTTKSARKKARTNKQSPKTDDKNDNSAIIIMKKCGAQEGSALLQRARELLSTTTNNNPILKIIIELLCLAGNNKIGAKELKEGFVAVKEKLCDVIITIAPIYKGKINCGDCLSALTKLLVLKHYAPLSCIGVILDGVCNLISRTNVCILQFLTVLPRSLHKEGNGCTWTAELAKAVGGCISFVDMVLLVPLKKETLKEEFEKFAKDLGVTTVDLELITFLFYCMHVKYYNLVNNDSTILAVLCASAETYKRWFGNCMKFVNEFVNFGGNVPHGEVFAARRIKNARVYTEDKLKTISEQLRWAYSVVSNAVPDYVVPTILEGSKIAERFAGNLTAEERAALLETLREACVKGGIACGNMRTAAAEMVRYFINEGLVETHQEILDLLSLFLSDKHASLYNGSVEGGKKGGATTGKMRTAAAEMVRYFINEGLAKTHEEILDLLSLFLSDKHASLYNGSVEGGKKGGATTGKMRTAAAEMVRYFINEGLAKTHEEILDLLSLFLSPKHASLYNGSVKGGVTTGKMRTTATEMVRYFIAEGLAKTHEEILDLLSLFLSPKHASLYNGSVKGGVTTGKMRTTATEMVRYFINEGLVETHQEIFDLLSLFLSDEHVSLYNGSVKGAAMVSKAWEMAWALVEDGVCETMEEAAEFLGMHVSVSYRAIIMGKLKSAPIRPRFDLNNGPWSPAEEELLVAGYLILDSSTNVQELASFVSLTRDLKSVRKKVGRLNDKLIAKVKAMKSPRNGKVKRYMEINLATGLSLQASVNKPTATITKVEDGSKLEIGDKILYVGDSEGGQFFSDVYQSGQDRNQWYKRIANKSRNRVVLVYREYDWPSQLKCVE